MTIHFEVLTSSPLSVLFYFYIIKHAEKFWPARGLAGSMDNDPCLAQYSVICNADLPSPNEKHILYLVLLLNYIIVEPIQFFFFYIFSTKPIFSSIILLFLNLKWSY